MFLNIGFGNLVNTEKILAVINPDSAPAKRLVQGAKEQERLIDATQGRKTKAVLILEGSQVVLSALQPETLSGRYKEQSGERQKTAEMLPGRDKEL